MIQQSSFFIKFFVYHSCNGRCGHYISRGTLWLFNCFGYSYMLNVVNSLRANSVPQITDRLTHTLHICTRKPLVSHFINLCMCKKVIGWLSVAYSHVRHLANSLRDYAVVHHWLLGIWIVNSLRAPVHPRICLSSVLKTHIHSRACTEWISLTQENVATLKKVTS